MTRTIALLTFALVAACSGIHVPDVDAASPPGDAGPLCPSIEIYNGAAAEMGCPETLECPACPVLINSGRDCATLARALEACPDSGV